MKEKYLLLGCGKFLCKGKVLKSKPDGVIVKSLKKIKKTEKKAKKKYPDCFFAIAPYYEEYL